MFPAPPTPAPIVCRACPAATLAKELAASAPGTVVRVMEGVYRGNFTLGRGVTLEGSGAVLDGGGNGTVLTIAGSDARVAGVTLRNSGKNFVDIDAGIRVLGARARVEHVSISQSLFGIDVKSADRVTIQGVTIDGLAQRDIPLRGDALRLFYSRDAQVTGNTFRDGRDVLVWFSNGALLEGNRISGCRYGIHVMYAKRLTLANNAVTGCEVGTYVMYATETRIERNVFAHNRGSTGYGVALKAVDDAVVRDNALIDDHAGVYLDQSPWSRGASLRVEGNLAAYNGVGLLATPATAGGVVAGNAFVDNLVQARASGQGSLQGLRFSSGGYGNYWSDYAGYDARGNGIGDAPYLALPAFGTVSAADPRLQLLTYSPAAVALDFAARALPAFAPRVQLVDRAPVLHAALPADLPWPPRSGSGVPLAAFAALGLGMAGVMGAAGRRGGRSTLRRRSYRERARGAALHPVIMAEGVRKSYGSLQALAGATFEIREGETVALWGPNGAGKTTLLKCLLGQVSYQGSLSVAGLRPGPRVPAARALMGYAPQSLPEFEMSVAELAEMIGALRGCGADEIAAALAQTGAQDACAAAVGALSGGMKQRLNVALALLGEPPILVLDEPTAGLDRMSHRAILELLRERKRNGRTILFTSHDVADVVMLAERVVMMEEGRVSAVLDVERFAALMRRRREEDAAWHRA